MPAGSAHTAINAIRALFDASQNAVDHQNDVMTLRKIVWRGPYCPATDRAISHKMHEISGSSTTSGRTAQISSPAELMPEPILNLSDSVVHTLNEPSPVVPPATESKPEKVAPEQIETVIRGEITRWLDENMSALVEHALRDTDDWRKTSSHTKNTSTNNLTNLRKPSSRD